MLDGTRWSGRSCLTWLSALATVVLPACGPDAAPGLLDRAGVSTVVDPLLWEQQAQIFPEDPGDYREFGASVCLQDNTALIGATLDDDQDLNAGAAYAFVRSGGTWMQQDKLLASDGQAGDQFGVAVSLYGDTAPVGAHWHDANGSDSGAAYVFVRNAGVWSEEQKIVAGGLHAGDELGRTA